MAEPPLIHTSEEKKVISRISDTVVQESRNCVERSSAVRPVSVIVAHPHATFVQQKHQYSTFSIIIITIWLILPFKKIRITLNFMIKLSPPILENFQRNVCRIDTQ